MKRAGFKVAMKPYWTLRQDLVTPKDKICDKHGVVYKINCSECDATYIGQTGRNLSQRVKEHHTATVKGQVTNSGIAQHAWDEHHDIDWDNIKILAQESSEGHRQVREALFIHEQAPSMNRDVGIDVPQVYFGIAQGRQQEISRDQHQAWDLRRERYHCWRGLPCTNKGSRKFQEEKSRLEKEVTYYFDMSTQLKQTSYE